MAHTNFTNRKLRAAAAALLLGAAGSAQAIVVNSSFGAAGALAYGSSFSSVVRINSSLGQCSGVLISATAVATAQHCTFGTNLFAIGFDQNGDGSLDATLNNSGKWEFDGTNILLDGTDIAVLLLNSALPAWATPMRLFDGNLAGQQVVTSGWGRRGVGVTQFANGVERWAADNTVDAVGGAYFSDGSTEFGSSNIINTDFDDGTAASNTLDFLASSAAMLPREGTTAGGDSGGPLMLQIGSEYFATGVLAGGTLGNSAHGDISWWTGLAPYRTQLESFGAVFYRSSGVPEPAGWALVVAALGGVATRRRKLKLA
jgi:hypothetical protein